MRALTVKPGTENSAAIQEVAEPKLTPQAALIRMIRAGVCVTDEEIVRGLYGQAPPGEDRLILGHESLGRVEEVSPDAGGVQVGDLVVATVRRPDDCPNCEMGEYDMCLWGAYAERGIKGIHGYMAEYYAEHTSNLVKVPPELEAVAVLLEPLSIVAKAIYQALRIQHRTYWEPGPALVLGAGAVGLLATMTLRSTGVETFTMATRPADSLKARVVQACGAHYLNARETPIASIPSAIGKQPHLIVEATGDSAVAFQSFGILGNNGVLCLTGVSAGHKTLEIPSDLLNLQIVLGNKVVFGSVSANRMYFEMGVEHMAHFENMWPGLLAQLITRRIPLADWREALQRDRESIKTVLEISA